VGIDDQSRILVSTLMFNCGREPGLERVQLTDQP